MPIFCSEGIFGRRRRRRRRMEVEDLRPKCHFRPSWATQAPTILNCDTHGHLLLILYVIMEVISSFAAFHGICNIELTPRVGRGLSAASLKGSGCSPTVPTRASGQCCPRCQWEYWTIFPFICCPCSTIEYRLWGWALTSSIPPNHPRCGCPVLDMDALEVKHCEPA